MTCSKNDIWKMPFMPIAGIQSQRGRSQLVFGKSSGRKRLPFSSTATR